MFACRVVTGRATMRSTVYLFLTVNTAKGAVFSNDASAEKAWKE